MADELNTVADVKSAKNKILDLLPKILPFIALAGAGLALIFTFLIGVSANAEGAPDYYIYHFFDGENLKAADLLNSAWKSATRTVILTGMLLTIFGLIAVLAFSGLTVYKAVRKYAFKDEESSVELFALCTYLSYVMFSAMFYAVNCVAIETEGVKVSSGYNAATICGLTLTTVTFFAYYALKTVVNRAYFKDKINIAKFSFAALRIALLAVTAGLISAPIIKVTSGGTTIHSSFVQLAAAGIAGTNSDKLSSLVSTSIAGFLLIAVICVLSAVLTADNLSKLFSRNKKNDNVFYIILLVVVAFLMIIAAVAGGFYSDIVSGLITDNVTAPEGQSITYVRTAGGFNVQIVIAVTDINGNILETVRELGTISIATVIPVIACVMILLIVVLNAAYPAIITAVEKKIVKVEAAKKLKAAEANAKVEESEKEKAFLEVDNLCQYFIIGRDFFGRPVKSLKAVDKVSFKLEKGKTLGIVGESGCGKTTMGRTILRLYDVTSGEVWFKGEKISSYSNREFDKLRPEMQMIFQDPYASLSPRLTVGDIIGEAALRHKIVDKAHYRDYVIEVMKMCGLQPHYFERYPHEFSGGQRQRICIARALALKPELVICDEPVSALDVSIQAQIINMLIELRKTLGLTYIFISHDLSVVKHISDQVGVMYLGSMVEYGSKRDIFDNTLHPYTKALFSAVPVPDPHVKMNRIILKGDIPSPVNPPKGCKFHTRCDSCMEICKRIAPVYKEVEEGHFCACHLYNTEEETKQLELDYEEEQRLLAEATEAKPEKKSFTDVVKNVFKKKKKVEDKAEPEVEDAAEE